MAIPTLAEIRAWCEIEVESMDDDMLQDVIDAELEDQRGACRVPINPDEYPHPLAQALKRRVARECALRGIPLGVINGIADGGAGISRVSGIDRDIQRLERRYIKLTGA